MDILYTADEKYLQAIEELSYGELPKALHYFNALIEADPTYARAYYQLGCFYQYRFKNYRSAGYYYKECILLDADFPDVYAEYLTILITLKMHKLVQQVAETALHVPGVDKARIYELLGLYAEESQNFELAKTHYKAAELNTACQTERESFQKHLTRISDKQSTSKNVIYVYKE